MIQSVEIENFKCFRSLELPELSRVNLISGANNVGKTSLLEALFIFHDRTSPAMFLGHISRRGIDQIGIDPEMVWAPYFYNLDLKNIIGIKVERDGGAESATYKYNPVLSPPPSHELIAQPSEKLVSTEGSIRSMAAIEITYIDSRGGETKGTCYFRGNEPTLSFEGLPLVAPKAAIVPARDRVPSKDETARLSKVRETKRYEMVEDFLRIIAPDVKDLQVNTSWGKPLVFCDIGLPRQIPIGYAGDGLTRLLSIILEMAEAHDGGLVLIDEVENGIHYSVQEKFWKALSEAAKELDCQVIATTHSHECLQAACSAFDGLFEPEFRYIRLERIGEDIKAKTFTHEMLETALESDLEVR
ncbi:MAG TPA: hypothetical protein ENH84_04005 [Phycisphaerae bacterium]|nr:hypothetical protein [Phycisphaerae bacterium]